MTLFFLTYKMVIKSFSTDFQWSLLIILLEFELAISAGVSKWAGTRYFYPPEIVYSTGRNYWTPPPKISGGQNHKYDGR